MAPDFEPAERSLILLKPDAIQRGLVGEILSRLEARGLKFVAMRMMHVSEDLARRHYAEHNGKPFFDGLVTYITSSPIIALVVEGGNAVQVARTTIGATNPLDASPGSIRGDLAVAIGRNLVHGSDSAASATREIDLFFQPGEIASYPRGVDTWVTES